MTPRKPLAHKSLSVNIDKSAFGGRDLYSEVIRNLGPEQRGEVHAPVFWFYMNFAVALSAAMEYVWDYDA